MRQCVKPWTYIERISNMSHSDVLMIGYNRLAARKGFSIRWSIFLCHYRSSVGILSDGLVHLDSLAKALFYCPLFFPLMTLILLCWVINQLTFYLTFDCPFIILVLYTLARDRGHNSCWKRAYKWSTMIIKTNYSNTYALVTIFLRQWPSTSNIN